VITSLTKKKKVAAFIPTGTGKMQLLSGKEVFCLLEDYRFRESWDQLYATCPWATVFQSHSFVATWYQVYGKEYLPIVIKAERAGKLTGLLPLAKDKNGLITGAGTNQAEYQVWLGTDAGDETFITNALLEINRAFPRFKLQLKYIPAGVSLHFTEKDPIWSRRCFVKTSPQPLMIINDDHLTSELKKKNRREKMNRLKRLGELKFERITDGAAFASVIDELALQSDFRKGAMYNKVAFKTDPLRKEFFLSLFRQNNLHATIITIDDKIISSNVSIWGNGQLHLQGINSFDAAYARHSPGIIHFLLLGKLLAQEGVGVFDLTPGADPYKEILATDHSLAYTLSIGNKYHCLRNRVSAWLNHIVKKATAHVGIKPDALKKGKKNIGLYLRKFVQVAKQGFPAWFAFLANSLKRRSKTMKCWVVQKEGDIAGLLNMQKDDLDNLLSFDQRDIRYSQQEFLANAMQRFEEGAHCYSWAEDDRLLGCAWVADLQTSIHEYKFGSATDGFIISLSGLYCHAKGRKGFSRFLRSIANELSPDNTHDKIYILTDSRDDLVFRKAGFLRLK
jgi:CelD/BcsL family acetyltransferase involved in cellulose biosynthesis